MSAERCDLDSGFHEPEADLLGPFSWTHGRFALRVASPARYLLLEARYGGAAGTLAAAGAPAPAPLRRGWQVAGLDLGAARSGTVALEVSPVVPVDGDPRELGLAIRRASATNDAERFERLLAREENARENEAEFRAGAVLLRSAPPHLRVTVERACNVVPRCVYCEWDWAKRLEKGSRLDVASAGLESLGRFGRLARQVVDCSYGEPFLEKRLGAFLADLERRDTRLEMTCNGQILGPAERRLVLGKDVVLYVSLDAATREAYARLRNDRFDLLVENVTALCRERREHGGKPRVVVSFIVMRSSVREFGAFLDLVRGIGADAVKLRSLFAEGFLLPPATERGGAPFRYRDEALGPGEERAFAAEAERLAAEKGVGLHVDTDEFGKEERRDPSLPLCREPWETAYVLNRGIMPCCFGKRPVATLEGVAPEGAEAAIEAALNGAELREIRSALARRDLPRYCRESPSCPIVKRRLEEERAAGREKGEERCPA